MEQLSQPGRNRIGARSDLLPFAAVSQQSVTRTDADSSRLTLERVYRR